MKEGGREGGKREREREREKERERDAHGIYTMYIFLSPGKLVLKSESIRVDLPTPVSPTYKHIHTHIVIMYSIMYVHTHNIMCMSVCVGSGCVHVCVHMGVAVTFF